MHTTLAVQVTAEDIENGKRKHGDDNYCCHCPIAIALQRAFVNRGWTPNVGFFPRPYLDGVDAPSGKIFLGDWFYENRAAALWAMSFDNGEPVQPTEFIFFLS